MTLYISDQAEEFRIEIAGRFADSSVDDAATAWKAALSVNIPRRVSVDITRMTGYDRAGYNLLREFYTHGTHIVAGTPRSLLFLTQISASKLSPQSVYREDAPGNVKRQSSNLLSMPRRAAASGE